MRLQRAGAGNMPEGKLRIGSYSLRETWLGTRACCQHQVDTADIGIARSIAPCGETLSKPVFHFARLIGRPLSQGV